MLEFYSHEKICFSLKKYMYIDLIYAEIAADLVIMLGIKRQCKQQTHLLCTQLSFVDGK